MSCKLKCYFRNCKNDWLTRPELSYFRVPEDANRALLWMQLMGVLPTYYHDYYVCSNHFDMDQFTCPLRMKLKTDGMPKLNYNHESEIAKRLTREKEYLEESSLPENDIISTSDVKVEIDDETDSAIKIDIVENTVKDEPLSEEENLVNKQINIASVSKMKFTCVKCEKRYTPEEQINLHKKISFSNELFTCGICSKNLKKLICYLCEKQFPTQRKLYLHERAHVKKKGFKCSVCNRSFGTVGTLRSHKITHGIFICIKCGLVFRNKSQWAWHETHAHPKQPILPKPSGQLVLVQSVPDPTLIKSHTFSEVGTSS